MVRVLRRAVGCKESFQLGNLFGGVESDGLVVGNDYLYARTVLEGAKLLKLLGPLKGAGWPVDKLREEVSAVAIEADMPERREPFRTGPEVGQGTAREVESPVFPINDDLDDVGVIELSQIRDGTGGGDHGKFRIGLQAACEGRLQCLQNCGSKW